MVLRSPWLVLLFVACGPTAPPTGLTESSTSETQSNDESPVVTVGSATTTGGPPGTTTVTGTTVDLDSTDDGVNFVAESGQGECRPFCCNTFSQDCPWGEKCMPWATDGSDDWNDTRCAAVAHEPGDVGDPCMVEGSGVSGFDDCDVGMMCWDVDPGTGQGLCVQMCEGDRNNPICRPEGTSCLLSNNDLLNLCLPTCDPLADACDPGHACLPTRDSFTCVSTRSGEALAVGAPCLQIYDCQPGLVCGSSASEGPPCTEQDSCCVPSCDSTEQHYCRALCDLTVPDPCLEPGRVCTSWWGEDPAPVGYENVGVCV